MRQTVGALQRNLLAMQSDLFVFSDAPKIAAAMPAVQQVRDYARSITGFASVNIIERTENLGLAQSIVDGVTQLCERFGRVIVLEDDLVTSPHFLAYMNAGLDAYENCDDVVSIHGYGYPTGHTLPETFFLRGADCWGWATWARGWRVFNGDARRLLAELDHGGGRQAFNFEGSSDYTGMLQNHIDGKISSWAVCWYASAFLADKLTLYPGISLVRNIGNDGSGTHSDSTDVFDGTLAQAMPRIGNIPIQESLEGRAAFRAYFLASRPSFVRRCMRRLARIWQGRGR
jgi:hypothetical protein